MSQDLLTPLPVETALAEETAFDISIAFAKHTDTFGFMATLDIDGWHVEAGQYPVATLARVALKAMRTLNIGIKDLDWDAVVITRMVEQTEKSERKDNGVVWTPLNRVDVATLQQSHLRTVEAELAHESRPDSENPPSCVTI